MFEKLKEFFMSDKLKKIFILFITIVSLRFLVRIFNILFIIDIFNTIFNYIFVMFVLFVLLRFKKEKAKSYVIIMKYVIPTILLATSFVFISVFSMLIPYILYFILAVIILPLFEKKMNFVNVLRWLLSGILSIVSIVVISLIVIATNIRGSTVIEQYEFPNDTNKKLVLVEYKKGLGTDTVVLYQQKLGDTGLKCEKLVVSNTGEYRLDEIYSNITKKNLMFCGINIKSERH